MTTECSYSKSALVPTDKQIEKQLERLGHMPEDGNDDRIERAVKNYQRFHGLREDGEAGPVTIQHMSQPRCGVPDLLEDREELREWPDGCLTVPTWHDLGHLRGISDSKTHEAWLRCLKNWNEVCGINLTYTNNRSQAKITAEVVGTDSNVLAWSFLPSNRCRDHLDQGYSRSTRWDWELLVEVGTHELGHALGLPHGPNTSIMNATALGRFLRPQEWDINQVQNRYGPPKDEPDEPDPEPPDGPLQIGPFYGLVNGQFVVLTAEKLGEGNVQDLMATQ